MSSFNRREFLKQAATVGAVAAGGSWLAGCQRQTGGDHAVSQEKHAWTMATFWPPGMSVLYEGAERLAANIARMSGGRLTIQVDGTSLKGPELFDEVRTGTMQMGHSASYYWAGKCPAAQFFCAVPFGMNAQQMNAWLYQGGGQALWDEVYSPFNLVAIPCGNTGVQMGGWFRREIGSLSDLKGLKMRIPGLGGAVLDRVGVAITNVNVNDLYMSFETGVLDAAEWVGPYHDYLQGFYRIAKYYYYPGWQEPGSVLECMINRQAWEALPADLQAIVRAACAQANHEMLAEFEARNFAHLRKLVDEHGVQLRRFPEDVLAALRREADAMLSDTAAKDPVFRKVHDHFRSFQQQVDSWAEISEKAYYELLTPM